MRELVDYGEYRLNLMEELVCIVTSLVLSAVAAWILYKSAWGMLLGIIILPMCREYYRKKRISERKQELLSQFKDVMQSVSVALMSGYSIENAWKEAEKEIEEIYGKTAYMAEEMRHMNSGIRMNQPVEQLLYQFAGRSGCEDIAEFAEIFRFAKRGGGNFEKIIQKTVLQITEKMDVEREIETVIAGRKMEQKIMNVVPVGLLAYLNISSKEFLAPLYGNLFGAGVMTVAFLAYLCALIMAHKMIDIRI